MQNAHQGNHLQPIGMLLLVMQIITIDPEQNGLRFSMENKC